MAHPRLYYAYGGSVQVIQQTMSKAMGKKRVRTECEPSELVRYAALKNREEMEEFYCKNKSKLPPILQSRQIFLKQLRDNNNEKLHELTKKATEFLSERKNFSEVERDEIVNSSTQIIPRVGRLIFDRDNPRKIKREYLISYTSTDRNKTEPAYTDVESKASIHNKIESAIKIGNEKPKASKKEQKEEQSGRDIIAKAQQKPENIGLKKSYEKISLNKILLNLIQKQQKGSKRRKKSIIMKGMQKIQPWGNTLNDSENTTWIKFYK